MAYKVFTNGSTLQASELNENLMQQSIAVFSNASARTAAISSPVEGQMTYLEDVNRYDHWNGSDWQSPFGLTHLITQTIGSAVSSVTVSNVFSSSYDNYRIVFQGIDTSAVAALDFRIGSATTQYYGSTYYDSFTGGANGINRVNNNNNGVQVGYASVLNDTNGAFDVFNPFAAQFTTMTGTFYNSEYSGFFGGTQASTTSHTGFTLLPRSGTFTGGAISVYGYRKN